MDNQLATVSIPANVQKGWIMLGSAKADLAKRQELKSLELQKIIQNPGSTITEIESALASYRKLHKEMVDDGITFRNVVNEKVLGASLAIEKQYSPKENNEYQTVQGRLTDMKVEQETKNNASAAKEKEKQLYVAHVKNQYAIIEADYRERCTREINTMYVNYLKTNVQKPDVEAVLRTINSFVFDKSKATTFQSQHLTLADKQELMKSVVAPNLNALREAMINLVDEKFASYQHDLKAGTVQQVAAQAEDEIQDIRTELQQETGINTLAAQATETPTIVTEGKALRKTMEVVVEGSMSWASIVCMRFWSNLLIADHVNVKSWENLTIKQMAAAIGKWSSETGEQFEGLQYREVVK